MKNELNMELTDMELTDQGLFDLMFEGDDVHSVTGGDYSATDPWDAPGMSVRDFI